MNAQKPRGERKRYLTLETLEDRAVPATFGVPWNDPGHLTLSFAPDGTSIAGHTSSLFELLNARQPTATWQREMLRAFQTWAVQANINIGVVADGGQAFGTAGSEQHDSRFGDIRIGAQPMTPDELSISVPNDPALSSTLTGDVLVNTSDTFDGKSMDPYTVILHEAGHVFGIDDSTDPKSPMFSKYNRVGKLTPADVTALQKLYGVRSPDLHEGSSGNDTISKATTIQAPGSYNGATPLVSFGDISTNKDADVFAFRPPNGYKGPTTIRLQSSGLSLLAPHLTVLNAKGTVIGEAQASSGFGDTVSVQLNTSDPNATYYLKVTGATTDVFGIGSYGVAVSFDSRSTVSPASLDAVLRGPYQTLSPNDIAALFAVPVGTLFNNDQHANDDAASATQLVPSRGYARNSHYETIGSISSTTDVDFYRFQTADAPAGNVPLVLTVTARAMDVNGAAPRLVILDGDGVPVSAQTIANGNGTYTLQAVGIKPGGNYLLRVGSAVASGSATLGNYAIDVQFGTAAAQLSTLVSDSLTTQSASITNNFYVGESQLMHFVLAADSIGAAPGASVQMTIRDANGKVVYSLISPAGDAVSGNALFVVPGAYTIEFAAQGTTNLTSSSLNYKLLGASVSDPVGPVLLDPTLTPIYTAPGFPGKFQYPKSTVTLYPFWIDPLRI